MFITVFINLFIHTLVHSSTSRLAERRQYRFSKFNFSTEGPDTKRKNSNVAICRQCDVCSLRIFTKILASTTCLADSILCLAAICLGKQEEHCTLSTKTESSQFYMQECFPLELKGCTTMFPASRHRARFHHLADVLITFNINTLMAHERHQKNYAFNYNFMK